VLVVLKKSNILLVLLLCSVAWMAYVAMTAVTPASAPAAPDTIVIDAGHGGMDSGAVSPNGVGEKDINLAISFFLKEIAEEDGMAVIMTRTEDRSLHTTDSGKIRVQKRSDLEKRKTVLNETGAAAFISIHLNKFEQSKYKGAQVFSANNDRSVLLGRCIQQSLREGLADGNTREAKIAPSNVYMFKGTAETAAIVECGFLSNPEEEALLGQEEYQKKLAYYIYEGFKKYRDYAEQMPEQTQEPQQAAPEPGAR
jgi:N-acetylmuramoyl-L-alanine amidase